MLKDASAGTLLPKGVRAVVMSLFVLLVLVAIAGILWRGPAILLDLAGYAQALWCF